jgi:YGGT family
MTDYERTTVFDTVDANGDPVAPTTTTPSASPTAAPVRPTDPMARRTTVVRERSSMTAPSGNAVLQRVVALIFGILQALLVLRIVLLLLIANHDNGIVSAILSITDVFVDPFRGMFRLDHISSSSGSVFDVGAFVALIGWTLIEALILAVVRLGDRRASVDA